MAQKRERVFVERESDKGKKMGWRVAWLTFDPMAGAINLESTGGLAKKWTIALQAARLDAFEILQISDVATLSAMYGGGLLGWGIAALMSRWVKVPAIKLAQQTAEPGQKWVHLRAPGMRPKKTRELANRIAAFLSERGYSGMMPNLQDEALWKVPTAPIAIGCGVVILVVICIFAAIAIISSSS
jgi:hypothetical protein